MMMNSSEIAKMNISCTMWNTMCMCYHLAYQKVNRI
jgi:hypothetical protein